MRCRYKKNPELSTHSPTISNKQQTSQLNKSKTITKISDSENIMWVLGCRWNREALGIISGTKHQEHPLVKTLDALVPAY